MAGGMLPKRDNFGSKFGVIAAAAGSASTGASALPQPINATGAATTKIRITSLYIILPIL